MISRIVSGLLIPKLINTIFNFLEQKIICLVPQTHFERYRKECVFEKVEVYGILNEFSVYYYNNFIDVSCEQPKNKLVIKTCIRSSSSQRIIKS